VSWNRLRRSISRGECGTFAGKIAITINQGSVGNITTGDISPILQTAQFWDPINIETISYDADGTVQGGSPRTFRSASAMNPAQFRAWHFGTDRLGVLVFATWATRIRGHAFVAQVTNTTPEATRIHLTKSPISLMEYWSTAPAESRAIGEW